MQPLHTYRAAFGIKGKSKASFVEPHLIYAVLCRDLRDVWQGKTRLGLSTEFNRGSWMAIFKEKPPIIIYSSEYPTNVFFFCSYSYSNKWDSISSKLIFYIFSLCVSLNYSIFSLPFCLHQPWSPHICVCNGYWLQHDACHWNPPNFRINNTQFRNSMPNMPKSPQVRCLFEVSTTPLSLPSPIVGLYRQNKIFWNFAHLLRIVTATQ